VALSDPSGKTAFATFFVLPPAERVETRFVYTLSPSIVEWEGETWRYNLYIQKQGGTDAHPIRVTVLLPPDVHVVTIDPVPTSRQGDVLIYDWLLRTDLTLTLTVR
jgi:hypothetical protein